MPKDIEPIKLQSNKNIKRWYVYPDMLPSGKFSGFQDRDDETLLRGSFVVGQNCMFAGNSLPSIRDGYELVGTTEPNDTTPVQRAWSFTGRNGSIWEMKAYSTGIYAWLVGTSTEWTLLKGGFTTGLEFGYRNIGETEGEFHSFFCNGTNEWFQFNGAHATVSSVTANTITIAASTWTALGFYTAATRSVIINGNEYPYTGGEGTVTLTGVTGDPLAGGVVAGDLAIQSPREVAALTSHKSQVVMAQDGRLHARLETKKDVWNYSKLDNPDDFTTGSTDGDGGSKSIESSGPITAFGKLNGLAVALKKNVISSLEFVQSGDRVDIPRYRTLTSADDKSTTIGAETQRSTFSTPYGLVFVTPDKRLVLLTGMTSNNEPEYLVLSDPIQPIFDAGVHTDACGICVDNVIWYAFKSDIGASFNDTVVRGDMTRRTTDKDGKVLPIQWDAPYVGWNVKDWTSVYNSTTGKNEVHWHSSTNSATYRVTPGVKADNTNPFTATLRGWAETFDAPSMQKKIDRAFVQVKMSENTELLLTLLYDKDGVTQRTETTLSGDSSTKKFDASLYNPFGASSFGSQKFGSNEATDDTPLYHFDIEIPPNVYFFSLSLQFSTDGEGQNWEIVRFGVRVAEIVETNDMIYLT
ncbi:MAG: hypothetical protein WC763_05245 [Candidatus Paceibacterota bacterium]|jgi:hypothetical protein